MSVRSKRPTKPPATEKARENADSRAASPKRERDRTDLYATYQKPIDDLAQNILSAIESRKATRQHLDDEIADLESLLSVKLGGGD